MECDEWGEEEWRGLRVGRASENRGLLVCWMYVFALDFLDQFKDQFRSFRNEYSKRKASKLAFLSPSLFFYLFLFFLFFLFFSPNSQT
tara:strand:- start:1233 stop:1496 length:264 start_codon:yes stop_codon:yes gene_type:complete